MRNPTSNYSVPALQRPLAAPHSPDSYTAGPATAVYSPFDIQVDPMERLLLINFEGDPDSLYVGLEPQVFNDSINGKGMLVIAWRVDGRVDVYHQPGLHPNPEKFDIAGKGLAHLIERPMKGAYFNVEARGVQAYFAFDDLAGRPIEVRIKEQNPKKRKPFGLLAPMGDAAAHPSAMPLVLLHDFYFVRRRHTEIEVRINGQARRLDKLPLPMDGQWMYFARYSPDPLIATLNPARNGPLTPLHTESAGKGSSGEVHFELSRNGPALEIVQLWRDHGPHRLTMRFDPPFPNIEQLQPDIRLQGSFRIQGHVSTGSVSGSYAISSTAQGIEIALTPSGGWRPVAPKCSLKLIYSMAKIFKHWPKTYRWNATMRREGTGWRMESAWQRER